MRPARAVLAATLALLTASCAHQFGTWDTVEPAPADARVVACRTALGSAAATPAAEAAVAEEIRLVSWNVRKRRDAAWRRDFVEHAADGDLILIQEASLGHWLDGELAATHHRSFAAGYRRAGRVTGVLTMSRYQPLARCTLKSGEPWLRTPKATGITAYALPGGNGILTVVNVHALNFSIRVGGYRQQLARIRGVLESHGGPVILSGDFNTWRGARMAAVEELAAGLGLEPVRFPEDRRSRVLGRPLDHIYVRGLEIVSASTVDVRTSDHNPLLARFRVMPAPLAAIGGDETR